MIGRFLDIGHGHCHHVHGHVHGHAPCTGCHFPDASAALYSALHRHRRRHARRVGVYVPVLFSIASTRALQSVRDTCPTGVCTRMDAYAYAHVHRLMCAMHRVPLRCRPAHASSMRATSHLSSAPCLDTCVLFFSPRLLCPIRTHQTVPDPKAPNCARSQGTQLCPIPMHPTVPDPKAPNCARSQGAQEEFRWPPSDPAWHVRVHPSVSLRNRPRRRGYTPRSVFLFASSLAPSEAQSCVWTWWHGRVRRHVYRHVQ